MENQLPVMGVASGNAHKLQEIGAMIGGYYRAVPMGEAGFSDEIAETGATFEENAALKAETVSRALGLPVLADDSGLMVDALSGAPGVYSARFAGEHGNDPKNNALLLEKLRGVPDEKRTARFVSVIALAVPGKKTLLFRGECEGVIGHVAKGHNGFGYDPLFLCGDKTFAELTADEKNAISHRARALEKLKRYLDDEAHRR